MATAEPALLTKSLARTALERRVMSGVVTDDLFDDEPRFDYPTEMEFTCSDLRLIFDKQERVFLLKCESDEGVSVELTLTLHELEGAAIELLLAARARLGLKPGGQDAGANGGRLPQRCKERCVIL